MRKITIVVLSFTLIFLGMNLYGQNNICFSYECRDIIKSPTKATVILKSPNSEVINLFTDTVRSSSFSANNFFKTKGNYTLSIYFEAEKYGKDSLNYNFTLNGTEINTVISVSFGYNERLIKKGDIYVKGDNVLKGYIRLNNYYQAPKTIEIELDTVMKGNEYYKGPFFKITNYSKDILYGEHMPGYFWGTLSYMKNDSIVTTWLGNIDYMFADSPPLYPDSIKLATVGSFGYKKKLLPYQYLFEVMLSKKYQSIGIGIYDKRHDFEWWAGTKEFYCLKYYFSIEK